MVADPEFGRAELGNFLDPARPGWVQSINIHGEDARGILPFGEAPDYLSPREAREAAAKYWAAAHYAEADRTQPHTGDEVTVAPPEVRKPMMWIAKDPLNLDHQANREQFNGDKPAWGESLDDHLSKQGIEVPHVGDVLSLRMGYREVYDRRLEAPERDDDGNRITNWYWTILVRE